MKDSLCNKGAASDRITNRQMAEGLRRALQKNFVRVLGAAGQEWDRRFAGKDPSDACASVSVSTWSHALAEPSRRTRPALTAMSSQAA